MATFRVTVKRVVVGTVEIEADSLADAKSRVADEQTLFDIWHSSATDESDTIKATKYERLS